MTNRNESNGYRDNILFFLSILLLICQVFTAASLVFLFKAFLILKKKVLDYEKNLPLVRIETRHCNTTTATERPIGTNVNSRIAGEASPTIVPKRTSNRTSGNFDQPIETSMLLVPKKQFTNKQKRPEFRESFSSFASPRDSGNSSTSNMSPMSSISYDSKKTMQTTTGRQDENSTMEKRISRGSQGQSNKTPRDSSRDSTLCESGRTSSNSSYGPQRAPRVASYDSHSLKLPIGKLINENELRNIRTSRLPTMPIGMVGLNEDEPTDEKTYKRISRLLNQMVDEEASVIGDDGLENIAYHGDDNTSKRSSSEFSKKATLASQESVSSLNSESVHFEMNNNDMRNLDCEEELFINQDIVDEVRLNSVGSRVDCNDKHEEPLYMNRIIAPRT